MGDALTGGCLCGGVRYEITGPFRRAGHCHCSRCRKHSGAAASTQGRVLQEHFRLTQGGILLRTYENPGHAVKVFCSVCGSSLFGGSWPKGPEVSIRFGTLDDDPEIRPQSRTFFDEKAPWDDVTDDLPRHPGKLPS
jgi:hypothetical protein